MRALLIIDVQGTGPVLSDIKWSDGREMTPEDHERLLKIETEKQQKVFDAFIDRICELINVAINTDTPIVVMEEAQLLRPTNFKIRTALNGVPHITVRKKQHDGSEDFARAHKFLGVNIDEVTVCGLMTTLCVAQTVKGLRRMGYKVKVDATFIEPWDESFAAEAPAKHEELPEFCSSTFV